MGIAQATRIGAVHLTIADLARSVRFYESRLGLQVHRAENETAALGAGGEDLLVLTESPQAMRVPGTTGLYHFAILVPARRDLAGSLHRLVTTSTAMQGAADHGVSEALYLADPDGNGIEIYRDRPRTEWPMVDGRLRMGIEPLDFDDLLREWDEQLEWKGLQRETVVGHVHLHVSNLAEAHRFYVDILGFELMQRYGTTALFVSAGGYHHHIALNTWAGVGTPPPPAGAIGLRHFVVRLPDTSAVEDVSQRLRDANISIEMQDQGLLVRDPSQNLVMFTCR